jgi:amidase
MAVKPSTAADLWRMGAVELAGVIRSGQESSREVIEAHLQRIEAVNPAVNAVTVVLAEEALDAATAADRKAARVSDLPPCTVSRSPSRGASTWQERRLRRA